MGIQEKFQKSLDALTSEHIDRGFTTFSYLQGKHTIKVTIEVEADYGKEQDNEIFKKKR